MRYEAVAASAETYPVSRVCEVLGVSQSGYYAWCSRPPNRREQERARLKVEIRAVWEQNRRVYGAPRVHQALLDQGIIIGRHRVARLMREMGIAGKGPCKRRPRTTQVDKTHPVAPNVLDQQFQNVDCGEVWLGDITYIDTEQGFLYLAALMDLGSRQILGLAMADHLRTDLVQSALHMAVQHHPPRPDTLHHTDRGSQYTSADCQRDLVQAGLCPSMSRTGSCLDNAPMESFFATLKRECADDTFSSHREAQLVIFDYIMGFYNHQRKHSALDYLSPVAFAQQQTGNLDTPRN